MRTKYIDLISQTYEFPQEEFKVEDNELIFNTVPLMDIIKQYGTPLKITYLPKISQNVQKARRWFNVAIAKSDYQGDYHYCYCTKSSHFEFMLSEVLKNDVHLETSSAFDLNLVETLHDMGQFEKDNYIICNGCKKMQYIDNIAMMLDKGFTNIIPVLDNKHEFTLLDATLNSKCKVGIRIAAEEEPRFEFYTSRLGIRYNDIIPFYENKIKKNPKFELKMLHFFINTGIQDTAYYWNELTKCVNLYCDLKKICPELDSLNIGGGFPIKNSLGFLAINHWDREYERVFLGGLTCDSHDYYNSEAHLNAVFLPKIHQSADANFEGTGKPTEINYDEDPQYIGLFHTGAYQEAVGGYGGIQHCMLPAPKHIIIYRDEDGELCTKLFAKEQSYKSMLKILGY